MSFTSPVLFDVTKFGATGNGSTNDYDAINNALTAAIDANGCLYFPAGSYLINSTLSRSSLTCRLSIKGDGADVSRIIRGGGSSGNGFDLGFAQSGIKQPYGVQFQGISVRVNPGTGAAGTGIIVTYGTPSSTSDHQNAMTEFRNVHVTSEDNSTSAWSNGIDISGAWNVMMDDVLCVGTTYGVTTTNPQNWSALAGSGVVLRYFCVNSHFTNVRCNFWQNGIYYVPSGGFTEGLFFTNCVMVGVWKGANISGSGTRIAVFEWVGGMVEMRVSHATAAAAFSLSLVEWVQIHGCMSVTESPSSPPANVYFALLDNVNSASVVGNSWSLALTDGVKTTGTCQAIVVVGNNSQCSGDDVTFGSSTSYSRSFGNVKRGAWTSEVDNGSNNSIVNLLAGKGALAKLNTDASTSNNSEADVSWDSVGYDDFAIWSGSNPTRLTVPAGVKRVRLTAAVRWNSNSNGRRTVKIKQNGGAVWAADDRSSPDTGDCAVATPVLSVSPGNYFYVAVTQTSGGSLSVRAVDGTSFSMEIVG